MSSMNENSNWQSYENPYYKFAVHVIQTLDASPEANVNDYKTDMGNLRLFVDLMLNSGQSFENAKERCQFYKNK